MQLYFWKKDWWGWKLSPRQISKCWSVSRYFFSTPVPWRSIYCSCRKI